MKRFLQNRRLLPLLLLVAAAAVWLLWGDGLPVGTGEPLPTASSAAESFSAPAPQQDSLPVQQEDVPDDTPTTPSGEPSADGSDAAALPEDGSYTTKEDVAQYLLRYGHLPDNFITKSEARELGWEGGSLEPYAPGKCIGGSRFGNYEGLLPEREGRYYTECDIDTLGAAGRGAKRLVFSNDGLIYYTDDHYETFTLLYGEADG